MKAIQKAVSLSLVLALLLGLTLTANASESTTRSSQYFNKTHVTGTATGGGTIRIHVSVTATHTMQEIGVSKIVVNERQANGSYRPVHTIYQSQYPSLTVRNKTVLNASVPYRGKPGKYYYFNAYCYAKDARGTGRTISGSTAIKA